MTAELPSASTRIDETSGPVAAGTKYCAVIACVPTAADSVPRIYGNAAAIYAAHEYSEGVDYAALHMQKTKKPILFVPVPIATPGVIGRVNQSGNTNTSVVSAAVGGSGSLDECDVKITVEKGGVVGTDQIQIGVSLDGGRSKKTVKLGTANSYVIPYVGHTLSFGAGSLTTGETVLTYHSTAPMWDSDGMTAAKTGLANQLKQVRSWQIIGDIANSTFAGYITTAVNGYETTDERYVQAKASLRDRQPYASLSRSIVRMTGNPNLTFAEVGATGDTITRASGSWVTDGFAVGDAVTVSGSASNNFTDAKVTGVTALVLTLDTQDLTAEGPVGNVTVTAEVGLTFAEVGATGDTITRNRGSWLDDGFRIGDKLAITGTVSNNITAVAGLTAVTATVLTLDTDDLTAEFIGAYGVIITAGETKAQHVASLDAAMSSVASQIRLELGFGRGRILSPFLGGMMRRSASWHDNLRAYQHDVHIATWQKDLGPLDGVDIYAADGITLDEFDERVDGGALAAGFTCLRSWSNGPKGAFVAKCLTRGDPASILSQAWAMAVVNVAQATAQAAAEDAIGASLILNADGTATGESLNAIKKRVDSALARELLANRENEGQRASLASWTPHTDDDLSGPDATLNAVLALTLRGVLVHINTKLTVNAGA